MGLCKKRDALAACEKALFGGFFCFSRQRNRSRAGLSAVNKKGLGTGAPEEIEKVSSIVQSVI
jgi:hypothetical protein